MSVQVKRDDLEKTINAVKAYLDLQEDLGCDIRQVEQSIACDWSDSDYWAMKLNESSKEAEQELEKVKVAIETLKGYLE